MSAAEADKDRRSRMATSTMHQAPKKGGAGGAYTWGAAGDVTDFMPTQVVQPTVLTAAAPVASQPGPSAPFTASLTSVQQFPSLGTQPVAAGAPSAWTTRPQFVTAPAPTVQTVMTASAAAPAQSVTIRTARPSFTQHMAAQPVATRIVSGQTFVTSTPLPEQGYPRTSVASTAPVTRVIVDKDRRSRMATSTVNQVPKKGGAGGAYTWGTAGDVTDYVPAQVVQPTVMTAPAPVSTQPAVSSPFTGSLASAQEFPGLGTQPAAAPSPSAAWSSRPVPAAMTSETQSTAADAAITSPLASPVKQTPSSPLRSAQEAPSATPADAEQTAAAATDSTNKDGSRSSCSVQ